MIGIFIGVTAVVSLISLGQGLQDSINEEFQKIGTNRIIITPGSGAFGPTGSGLAIGQITEDDLEVVKRVKGIDIAAGVLTKSAKVEFKDEVQYLSIWGFPTDKDGEDLIDGTNFFDIENGRQFKNGDRYKIILGYNIAEDSFDKKILVGNKMMINDQTFSVLGIQKKAGTGVHDAIIRIPLETARELFDEPEEISTIFAFTQNGFEPEKVVEDIKKALRKHRGVDEGEEDFSVSTASQTIEQLNQVLDIVTIVIVGIAAISIVVGGIGIMNTMYTTVIERTKEIGVIKALGAKNGQIMFLFLVESGMLGLVGGLIGLVLGLGIAKSGEYLAVILGADIFKIHISVTLIVGALLFSFLLGALSGLLPARQASMLQPVEALRKGK
ncbi:ABC transporter permease [Candidatus Woesearchaeota archaeon]|nr:ABC transporter permease [Candidatus Woesearchaeota archaeon]